MNCIAQAQNGPGYVHAAPVSIKPTVASCASYIGAELDGLAAAIERLETAAASVLSPTGSDGSQAKEPSTQAVHSEAVAQLDALARRAAYLTSRINAIVGRLEL